MNKNLKEGFYFIFMICFIVIALFCTQASASFQKKFLNFASSLIDTTKMKTYEIESYYYFQQADLDNAILYANKSYESSQTKSDMEKYSNWIDIIKTFTQNYEKALTLIVINERGRALGHIDKCREIVNMYSVKETRGIHLK